MNVRSRAPPSTAGRYIRKWGSRDAYAWPRPFDGTCAGILGTGRLPYEKTSLECGPSSVGEKSARPSHSTWGSESSPDPSSPTSSSMDSHTYELLATISALTGPVYQRCIHMPKNYHL
jgi:hypothetical protein